MTWERAGSFVVEAFDPHRHERAGFTCGSKRIDNFLHLTAKNHQRGDFTRVWVARTEASPRVLGFYSINAHSLDTEELPKELMRHSPRRGGIPTVYVSMIGVHQSMQGKGLGRILMADAMKRAARASETIGIVALVLDVLDDDGAQERRAKFYRQLGFVSIPSRPTRRFITTATIRDALT